MAASDPNIMRALKGLVYVMGVLIVIAILLLSYGFLTRITDPDYRLLKGGSDRAAAPDRAAGVPAAAGFGEVEVALPPGCVVAEMRPDGTRLYLRISSAADAPPRPGCERIIIVDVPSGQVQGAVVLRP